MRSSKGIFRTVTVLAVGVSLAASSCTRGKFSFDGMSAKLRGDLAGTDVGNPKRPTKAAIKILDAVCETLARCLGVPADTCSKGVPTAPSISQTLGLPDGLYGQFSNLIDAESLDSIKGNLSQAESCGSEVKTLSCQDPRVLGAYNPNGLGNPFAAVSAMISGPSCDAVFGPNLRVTPWNATVASGKNLTLTPSGGIPPYTFAMEPGFVPGSTLSGGVANDAVYRSSFGAGVTTVAVRDSVGTLVFTTITVVSKAATKVSTASSSTCAIVGGVVECWGANLLGTLGDGGAAPSAVPRLQNPSFGGAIDLAMTSDSGCATYGPAIMYCWGSGAFGQVGNGGTANIFTPSFVTGAYAKVYGGAGGFTPLAIDLSGNLFAWGLNASGQVGNGFVVPQLTPYLHPGGPWIAAGSGFSHSCAIDGSGSVFCWGENIRIGNGVGSGTNPIPQLVGGSWGVVSDISVGWGHTCAISTGVLFCWGLNTSGQLGDNSTTDSLTPKVIIGSGVTAVVAGMFTTCAVVNGALQCWGKNTSGGVGIDSGGANVPTPTEIPTAQLGGPVTALAVGSEHACVVVNGVVKCWGGNASGQLGNGSLAPSSLPVVAGPWQ